MIHEKAYMENVELGKNSKIMAFAVVKGDEEKIKIGDNTNIQENCVIHGKGVVIGDNVTIGHAAVIHGAKIGNHVLIGINSTVLDGAEISDWSIIGAGSVVPPDKKLESGLYIGNPAKKIRDLTDNDKKLIIESYKRYL
jgi:carbonic anhydrase/acetyltransferase-like protein (isoleucine patch superfamily)